MCDGNALLNEDFRKWDKPSLWTADEDCCIQTDISQVRREVDATGAKGSEEKRNGERGTDVKNLEKLSSWIVPSSGLYECRY